MSYLAAVIASIPIIAQVRSPVGRSLANLVLRGHSGHGDITVTRSPQNLLRLRTLQGFSDIHGPQATSQPNDFPTPSG